MQTLNSTTLSDAFKKKKPNTQTHTHTHTRQRKYLTFVQHNLKDTLGTSFNTDLDRKKSLDVLRAIPITLYVNCCQCFPNPEDKENAN